MYPCNLVGRLFTLSSLYTPRLLCCCVKKKQGMINRASGWSPFPGLRLPGHTVKSADRKRALSFQHNLRYCSPLLSVLSLVCGCRSFCNCPHTYWRGFWGIHQCAAFSSSSPYLHLSVNLPLFLSASVCISLKTTFAFHYSIFVFLTLFHLPTSLQPPFLSHTT